MFTVAGDRSPHHLQMRALTGKPPWGIALHLNKQIIYCHYPSQYSGFSFSHLTTMIDLWLFRIASTMHPYDFLLEKSMSQTISVPAAK